MSLKTDVSSACLFGGLFKLRCRIICVFREESYCGLLFKVCGSCVRQALAVSLLVQDNFISVGL